MHRCSTAELPDVCRDPRGETTCVTPPRVPQCSCSSNVRSCRIWRAFALPKGSSPGAGLTRCIDAAGLLGAASDSVESRATYR